MIHNQIRLSSTVLLSILLLLTLTLLPRAAQAVAVGDGTVAPPCGEAEFNAALSAVQTSGGGTLTFNCGTATINFTGEKVISSAVVIDGGGVITLDGGGATRFFKVLGGGSLTLRGMVLDHGNSGNDYGGAVYVNPGGVLNLESSTLRNSATSGWAGGAIIDFAGTVTLTDSVIENSQSSYGAINSTGTLTLIRTSLRNNAATLGGGAMSVGGTVKIQDSLIEGNSAPQGGAMYMTASARVEVLGSRFLQNVANAPVAVESMGGGIFSYGELTVRGSTFEANTTDGYGGAILAGPGSNDAWTQIYTSTFVANQAGERGGAVDNRRGPLTVVNSTFSGNSAGTGGAIQNFLGPARLVYVTLAGNNGGVGGGLDQTAQPGNVDDSRQRFDLSSTALAGLGNCGISGTPGPMPHFVSNGYNLSEDGSCAFFLTQSGDVNNTPAQLGILADNSGSTFTHLPASTSPLVDGSACLTDFSTDQRGVSRPQGALCDIGAVEAVAPAATPTPTQTPTVTPTWTPFPTPTETPEPLLIPAQVPNAVTVSISVNPTHAYAGQTVTVSGKGAAGFGTVRILSIQNARTVGSKEVAVDAQGNYSLILRVPSAQAVAPTRLCASAGGTANAQMACAAFTVDPMPTGQLQGQISGLSAGALNAQFNLVDRLGVLRYTGPVNSSGAFNLSGIDPGVYKTIITGQTSKPVSPGTVTLLPNTQSAIDLSAITLAPGINCAADPRTTAYLKLVNDINPVGGGNGEGNLVKWQPVSGGVAQNNAELLRQLGQEMLAKSQRDYFGVYLSGVARSVEFLAFPQTTSPAQSVIFRLVDVDGTIKQAVTTTGAPFTAALAVDRLSPSQGEQHPHIQVVPVINGREDCPSTYPVHVMADPAVSAAIKPYQDMATFWDAGRQRYQFIGFIPKAADVHFSLPPEPLPVFETFDNQFRAGLIFWGYLYENGKMEITQVWTEALARALSVDLYDGGQQIDLPLQPMSSPWEALKALEINLGTFDLVKEDYSGLPFVHVPVVDLFGLVQLHVASSGGVTYGIQMDGWIKPFVPEVKSRVTATAGAQAEVGYGLGIIGGVAAVGYSLGLGAALDVPLDITVLPSPDLSVPQVCFRINAFVRAWAQYLWGIKLPGVDTNPSWKKVLAEYPLGCLGPFVAAADIDPNPLPDDGPLPALFASPSVASSPDGRVLSAYVVDRSATNTAQVQVLARFQDPATGAWLAQTALSDPAHSAVNPVAFFAGPDTLPIVAWAELPYDAATATALGEEIDAHLSRQEIFYAVYQNGVWGTPIRLTDDLRIDGMPTAAGGPAGAVLAWTRDTDADHLTRTDQRIAVSLFDTASATFGPMQTLAAPAGGMNTDVRAALAPDGTPHLVWINDADGVLDTGDDRRMAWAYTALGEQGAAPDWVVLNPQPLPPRVDSPAISVGADGLELAFLVRQPADDGSVPLLGPNGVLWTAKLSGETWTTGPIYDEDGGLVFAEQPVLAATQGESLLAFRRFDPASLSHAALGQISLARQNGDGGFTAPLYLTDAPAQNWQPALTINPTTRQAVILKVARPVVQTGLNGASFTDIAQGQAIMAGQTATLSAPNLFTAQDPVESVLALPTADPALDPMTAAPTVVPAGETITVTVSLRNVGRDPATAMTVTLYAGTAGSGAVVGVRSVADPVALNATVPLTFPVAAAGGAQTFTAQITTSGGNASPANDQASLMVGIPSAPQRVTLTPGVWTPDTLEIAWTVADGERPAGFRVLRGNAVDGPFELVGESGVTDFTDVLAGRGEALCYGVQAHNNGTLSAISEVVCGEVEMLRIYLPLLLR